jgi:hypothetical protein
MKIEYRTAVDEFSETDARLVITVLLDGEEVGRIVPLSGRKRDVLAYAAGEIDMSEVRKRWGMRGRPPSSTPSRDK